MVLKVYTDASVTKRKTVIGFVIKNKNETVYQSIISAQTQNVNYAELLAVKEALMLAKEKKLYGFKIYTDSMYVLKKLTKELKEYNKEVNKMKLMMLEQRASIEWVKGHSNNKGNIEVDKIIK